MLTLLQTDAEAKQRAQTGPLFKPRTPEIDYEISSRHRKAENNALAKIQHETQEQTQFSSSLYDEAAGQVCMVFPLLSSSIGKPVLVAMTMSHITAPGRDAPSVEPSLHLLPYKQQLALGHACRLAWCPVEILRALKNPPSTKKSCAAVCSCVTCDLQICATCLL